MLPRVLSAYSIWQAHILYLKRFVTRKKIMQLNSPCYDRINFGSFCVFIFPAFLAHQLIFSRSQPILDLRLLKVSSKTLKQRHRTFKCIHVSSAKHVIETILHNILIKCDLMINVWGIIMLFIRRGVAIILFILYL